MSDTKPFRDPDLPKPPEIPEPKVYVSCPKCSTRNLAHWTECRSCGHIRGAA